MARSPIVYNLPANTVPKVPLETISSAQWNAAMNDIAQTFNTPQPIEYGGTNATTVSGARTNLGINEDVAGGQCRLQINGTSISLYAYNGNSIKIAGQVYKIPVGGVTLAPTSLVPGTNYNVYAYITGGNIALEAASTAHVPDTTAGNIGVEIKSGDTSRSLVGKARIVAGPIFVDSASQRFVLSWFNQQSLFLRNSVSSNFATTATSPAELTTTIRSEFLSWGDAIHFSHNAHATQSTPARIAAGIGIDGTATLAARSNAEAAGAGIVLNLAASEPVVVSEGYHFATLCGWVSAGTANFISTTDTVNTYISAQLRG